MKPQLKIGEHRVTLDLQHLQTAIEQTIEREIRSCVTTCMNCGNFSEGTEQCELNGMRPPARIIANGCECWTDVIPF